MSHTNNPLGQTIQDAFMPKKAVSYLRVSGARQAQRGGGDDEGYSLPAQREANKRKAHSMGALVTKEFVERGESAKTSDRNELQQMLEYIKENQVDYVIVNKVDRLARNRLDDALMTKMVYESGAELVSATENIDGTPQGMLLHGILASIAEFYSQNLSTEVMKGLNQKVKSGGTPGLAPLGYLNISNKDELGRRASYVVIDEERAPFIKLAYELYATGDWSVLDLAEYLEVRGLVSRPTPSKPARPLKPNNLHKVLTNPYYKGIVVFNGAMYEGKHEPLVDEITWQKAQDVLSSHNNGERTRIHDHFLKSTLYCGTCGKRLIVHNAKSSSGKYYPYFVCVSKHLSTKKRHLRCEQRAVLIPKVEELVEELYEQINLTPESRQLLEAWLMEEIERTGQASRKEISDLEKQRHKLKDEEEKLLQAHYAEAISLDLMKKEQQRISKAVTDINARLIRLNGDVEDIQDRLKTVLDSMEDCAGHYRQEADYVKRLMNQAFFEKIVVNDDGTLEPTYSEVTELLVSPELKTALKDAGTACQGENEPVVEAIPSLTEIADTTPDMPKKSKKPVIADRLPDYIKTLTSFFGEGLRKTILVRHLQICLNRWLL